MKISEKKQMLIVYEAEIGDESEQYRKWLENNLPENVKIEWIPRTTGVGSGLFMMGEYGWEEIDNPYWDQYCKSGKSSKIL